MRLNEIFNKILKNTGKSDLSETKIGQEIGESRQTINKIRNRKIEHPNIETYKKIYNWAKTNGMPNINLEWLIGISDVQTNNCESNIQITQSAFKSLKNLNDKELSIYSSHIIESTYFFKLAQDLRDIKVSMFSHRLEENTQDDKDYYIFKLQKVLTNLIEDVLVMIEKDILNNEVSDIMKYLEDYRHTDYLTLEEFAIKYKEDQNKKDSTD